MFKLAMKKEIEWPVTVNVPQDGGGITKATFHVKFEVLTKEELEELAASGGDVPTVVTRGWRGVAGEDGEEIPYSVEAKKVLVNITYVRHALLDAYAQLQQGREAPRKN